MANIELVIKIPEEEYINIKSAINSLIENGVERASMSKVCLAILGGTPLPKGHGNIYDERDLEKLGNVYFQEEVITTDSNLEYRFPKLIINATPIIEADKGE